MNLSSHKISYQTFFSNVLNIFILNLFFFSAEGLANSAPSIDAGDYQSATLDKEVFLTGTASDEDGDSLTYTWSISSQPGSSYDLLTSTDSTTTSFTGTVVGDYVFEFSVSDGTNTSSDIVTLSVYSDSTSLSENERDSSLEIGSLAFKDTNNSNYHLPLSYTCYGADNGISPLISWSGIPDSATNIAMTMHSVNDDNSVDMQFALYDIDTSLDTLPEGDFSIGETAISYSAPCMEGAGIDTNYIFTLYAYSDEINLDETSSVTEVTNALIPVAIATQTLTTKRISYDDASIAADLHVPSSVPSTCDDKSAHFDDYSSILKSVTCNENKNLLGIVGYLSSGIKTSLSEEQLLVGSTRWIGRLALPKQSSFQFPITPSFLSEASSNISCEGETLGVSVDGQIIAPYYLPDNSSTATGYNCGLDEGVGKDIVVFGSIDQCYGHGPQGDGYHLHGPPICLMDVHDPSKPIAYMRDGIPLYFGQGGGTITDSDNAQTADVVTTNNYGAGRFEHLDYRPSDVIDGSNPLNECNAYDINGDGATSGYVYYTSQDAPYSIGCFMGELSDTKFQLDVENWSLAEDRQGWEGQNLGNPLDVEVTANYYGTDNDVTYNITEMLVNETTSFFYEGDTAQVFWRILDESDEDYTDSVSCFEFRYRADQDITDSDETEIICADSIIDETTLSFTPFGNL